jgi:hypothetical protein
MELSRYMKHLNRAARRALAGAALVFVVNGYASYLARDSFDLLKYVFGSGLIVINLALGIIIATVGANWLAKAAERGKLK